MADATCKLLNLKVKLPLKQRPAQDNQSLPPSVQSDCGDHLALTNSLLHFFFISMRHSPIGSFSRRVLLHWHAECTLLRFQYALHLSRKRRNYLRPYLFHCVRTGGTSSSSFLVPSSHLSTAALNLHTKDKVPIESVHLYSRNKGTNKVQKVIKNISI